MPDLLKIYEQVGEGQTGRQNSKVQTSSCISNFDVFAFLILEIGSGRTMQRTKVASFAED